MNRRLQLYAPALVLLAFAVLRGLGIVGPVEIGLLVMGAACYVHARAERAVIEKRRRR